METEKEELKKLILIHLNREVMYSTGDKEITCENFSSFYGESRNSRCLLDEYSNKEGKSYFNIEEIMDICHLFRMEKPTKCENDGHFVPGEIPLHKELIDLLNKFRKRHEVEDIKPANKSL